MDAAIGAIARKNSIGAAIGSAAGTNASHAYEGRSGKRAWEALLEFDCNSRRLCRLLRDSDAKGVSGYAAAFEWVRGSRM